MINRTVLTLGAVALCPCCDFGHPRGAGRMAIYSRTETFCAASAAAQGFGIGMSICGLSLRAVQRLKQRHAGQRANYRADYRNDAIVRRTVSIR